MEERINVAEILKHCPKGMELDCIIYNGVATLGEVTNNMYYPISINVSCNNENICVVLTEYGQTAPTKFNKCVIFPKGKTTWEGFVPPCKFKDGDIVVTKLGNIAIISNKRNNKLYNAYCTLFEYGTFTINDTKVSPKRLATEEEKENLFKTIKDRGYKWDEKTKTLEKLPKFKIGDWVVNIDEKVNQVVAIDDDGFTLDDGSHCNNAWNKLYRLWTIQDAKDGDVLVGNYDNCKKPWIGIFKCISKDRPTTQFDSYCFINSSHHTFITPLSNGFYNPCKGHTIRYAIPATKEQRDVLFQKMNEAGYEWDADKKELRKIEWKPAWSEEDEMMLEGAIDKISDLGTGEMVKDWLKSLKYRIQPKVELTQLDKNILEAAIAFVVQNNHFNCWRGVDKHTVLSALHSLRPQKQWKPSEEQIEALERMLNFAHFDEVNNRDIVRNLLSQLKKLREE